jgi:transcriptional regulator with XRE-family HTH domain
VNEENRDAIDDGTVHPPSEDFEESVRRMVADSPELAAALEEGEPAFQVTREIIRARREEGISQAELARRMRTTQSVVSRLESMETTPNLRTVFAAAKALGRRADLRFLAANEDRSVDRITEAAEGVQVAVVDLMDALRASVEAGQRERERDELGGVSPRRRAKMLSERQKRASAG